MSDKQNVFAAILAGGSGTRMGNPEKPKQYLMLGSKPIIVHTIEKFCASNLFDAVLVLCPAAWVQQTRDINETRYRSAAARTPSPHAPTGSSAPATNSSGRFFGTAAALFFVTTSAVRSVSVA